ncbi:uncharacterized protein V6R79_007472 [Siganus canaliculatus]
MKTIVVFILVVSCCLGELQVQENDDKVHQCTRSSSQCCDACSLTSIGQNLGAMGEKVANMAAKIALLETTVQNSEKELLKLKSLTGGTPQVAFSAALRDSGSGNTGPFSEGTPLQYKTVFTNVGSSYNPSTGVFTATIKGTYYFRFSMFANLGRSTNSAVTLRKNGVQLVSASDVSMTDTNDLASNAVVISLEVGDAVYVELQAYKVIYDDAANYNTFSGFLLFAA